LFDVPTLTLSSYADVGVVLLRMGVCMIAFYMYQVQSLLVLI
jgi:hypothetical protein